MKEDTSIAGETEAGGDPSEALKHKIDVKDYVTINGNVLNRSLDHLLNLSTTMA